MVRKRIVNYFYLASNALRNACNVVTRNHSPRKLVYAFSARKYFEYSTRSNIQLGINNKYRKEIINSNKKGTDIRIILQNTKVPVLLSLSLHLMDQSVERY